MKTTKERYDIYVKVTSQISPLERLRFFCSLAMNDQDWLDVEPFFQAILQEKRDSFTNQEEWTL